MEIGIFARTFARPTAEEVFDAVVAAGIPAIQFNWLSAGLDPLPGSIDDRIIQQVRQAAADRNLQIASVSGTFNMIHPDPAVRVDGMDRLTAVMESARKLGSPVVTLCTGTRDPVDMWRNHPDNATDAAWTDLLTVMAPAVAKAEEIGVVLGVEPEVNNVVSSPTKARQLLDTIQSSHLGIIMDGANVFPKGGLSRQHEILDNAFALLGDDIVLAHAKDTSRDGDAGHEAAGTGLLDYNYYVKLMLQSSYDGPLVLHSLSEAQVPGCVAFLQEKLEQAGEG
ncbi:MAG: sugar phosphate isomerase/epimerase [Caldilineaceae bacterium]|nr:sugar phosphate isomerase/epimerase [Caldilineaceae bacterium]